MTVPTNRKGTLSNLQVKLDLCQVSQINHTSRNQIKLISVIKAVLRNIWLVALCNHINMNL